MGELRFGTATSSYQIEGGAHDDGRGPSIWDTFAAQPGRIADGSDGSVACDSYHRLDDDLELLAGLGADVYRFSVAWPRVLPAGRGRVEPRGLDYYDRLVDGLLARGVEPLPTLYHWDLPQQLEDAGGWPERSTAEAFAEYAAVVVARLGDRVPRWATLNEPWCSAFLGYAAGVHAPGRRDPAAAYAAAHHLLLGHALAAEVLRAAGRAAADVGIVCNLMPVWRDSDDGAVADAARIVDAVQNRLWLDALVDGRYPDDLLAVAPALDDVVRPGDLEQVRGSAGWLGVNYYTPLRVGPPNDGERTDGATASAYPGAPPHSLRARPPTTEMGWEVEPRGLEEVLVDLARRTRGLPLVVSENGAAYADRARADDGSVDDRDRIDYLRRHVDAVHAARAAGADVRAYLAWSLLDNFEWAWGYTKRFGIVEVDPGTRDRRPKASYHWLATTIRQTRASSAPPPPSP